MLLAPLLALLVAATPLPQVRDGDVVFQTSTSAQSAAIQRATHSRWSHMGIVFLRDFDLEEPLVKRKLAERYGARVPLDEAVISPGAIFDSEELVTVESKP